jgi:hypothetical protein
LGADADELGAGLTLEAEVVVVVGVWVGVRFDVLGAGVAAEWGGAAGLGASTPAVAEPRPSFCRLGASILPLELRPLSD